MERGVFPDPPDERPPTDTTQSPGTLNCRIAPLSNAAFLRRTASPNRAEPHLASQDGIALSGKIRPRVHGKQPWNETSFNVSLESPVSTQAAAKLVPTVMTRLARIA